MHTHTHVHIQIHNSFLRLNDNRNSFTRVEEGRPRPEPMTAAGCAHSWASLQASLRPSCFTSRVKMFLSPRQFLTNLKLRLSARRWISGWVPCLTATLSASCPFPSVSERCNRQQQAGRFFVWSSSSSAVLYSERTTLTPAQPNHGHTFSSALIRPWKRGVEEG